MLGGRQLRLDLLGLILQFRHSLVARPLLHLKVLLHAEQSGNLGFIDYNVIQRIKTSKRCENKNIVDHS